MIDTKAILKIIDFYPTQQLRNHYHEKINSIIKKMEQHNEYKLKITGHHPIFLQAEEELREVEKDLNQYLGSKISTPPYNTVPAAFEEFSQEIGSQHLEALNQYKTPIPKKLHFVWIGGSLPKANEIFLDIWLETMEPDWQKTLWVDSQKLLLNYVKKSILDVAETEFTHQRKERLEKFYPTEGYEETLKITYLKSKKIIAHQLAFHEFFTRKRKEALPEEEIYIDFLTTQLKQEKNVVLDVLAQQKEALETLKSKPFLQIREISELMSSSSRQTLKSIYDLETSLRINLAAASDIVRYQALDREGGAYYDLDTLPPLHSEAKKLIHAFNVDEEIVLKHYLFSRYSDTLKAKELPNPQPSLLREIKKFKRFFTPINTPEIINGHLVAGKISYNHILYAHPNSLSNPVHHSSISLFKIIQESYQPLISNLHKYSSATSIGHTLQDLYSTEDFRKKDPYKAVKTYSLVHPCEMYFLDGLLRASVSTIYFTGPQMLSNYRFCVYNSIIHPTKNNLTKLRKYLETPIESLRRFNYKSSNSQYLTLYPDSLNEISSSPTSTSTWFMQDTMPASIRKTTTRYLPKIQEHSFYKHNIQLVFLDNEQNIPLFLASARLKNKHPKNTTLFFVKNNKIYRNIQATQELNESIKLNPFTRLQLLGYSKKHHDFSFGNHTSEEIENLLLDHLDQDNLSVGTIRFVPLNFNNNAITENDFLNFAQKITFKLQQSSKRGSLSINTDSVNVLNNGEKINYRGKSEYYKSVYLFDNIGIEKVLLTINASYKIKKKEYRLKQKYKTFEKHQLTLRKKDTRTASKFTRQYSETVSSSITEIKDFRQINAPTLQLRQSVEVLSKHLQRPKKKLLQRGISTAF